jgi:hypothetical protein
MVEESNHGGLQFRRWKAFHSQEGSSPIAAIDEGLLSKEPP